MQLLQLVLVVVQLLGLLQREARFVDFVQEDALGELSVAWSGGAGSNRSSDEDYE